MNSLRDTSPTIDALSLRDPATTGITQEMTSRLNTAWQPFVAKGPRKNNYLFSHPIFGADSAGPQSRNPQLSLARPAVSLLPGRPNLHQIWARNLGRYSFAGPKLRDSGVLPVEMDDETTEPRRSLGYVQ